MLKLLLFVVLPVIFILLAALFIIRNDDTSTTTVKAVNSVATKPVDSTPSLDDHSSLDITQNSSSKWSDRLLMIAEFANTSQQLSGFPWYVQQYVYNSTAFIVVANVIYEFYETFILPLKAAMLLSVSLCMWLFPIPIIITLSMNVLVLLLCTCCGIAFTFYWLIHVPISCIWSLLLYFLS